jgi:hypothetical protein
MSRPYRYLKQAYQHGRDAAMRGYPRRTRYEIDDYRVMFFQGYDDFSSASSKPNPIVINKLNELAENYNNNIFPVTTPEDFRVNKSNLTFIFAAMLPELIAVKVAYPNTPNRSYTYKALQSQNIVKGDKVVVDSPNSGLTVVEVVSVGTIDDIDPDLYNGYKWIVGKVDMADYAAVTAKEVAFRDKVAELQRVARRKAAIEKVADQVGGLAELQKLLNEMADKEVNTHETPLQMDGLARPA